MLPLGGNGPWCCLFSCFMMFHARDAHYGCLERQPEAVQRRSSRFLMQSAKTVLSDATAMVFCSCRRLEKNWADVHREASSGRGFLGPKTVADERTAEASVLCCPTEQRIFSGENGQRIYYTSTGASQSISEPSVPRTVTRRFLCCR